MSLSPAYSPSHAKGAPQVDIISLIVILVVIGVILWVINTYVPMDPKIRTVLNIAVVVLVILWLLSTVLGIVNLDAVRVD
jgi:hypothetical protein